jgi:hypothetical protein
MPLVKEGQRSRRWENESGVLMSGRKERERCCKMLAGMGATRRKKTMPVLLEAFAPDGQGWLELCTIWHGWCRNEGAISLQYASEISSY